MSKPLLDSAAQVRIVTALAERHAIGLRGERLTVEAHRAGENITAALTLASLDRTFVYTMEAAIVHKNYPAMSAEDALDACLDFLDWYLGEYFREHRELLLPLDWQPHRFGDIELMAKAELRNALLDEAADAWLRGERPEIEAQVKAIRRGKR